ncbi:hypothetical protein ENSA5_38350 [Enhygromyxa salina]|uniref:DUF5689 domain-containing protein n=1 Tax=Enhygromyxa salina TaxID=215803 RepID=A0A2S9XRJ5_9BACT|nr:hypothetical protein [Enhygromyxa salina]PRP95484.1 hypothetical protein ENSA5_38350 [Enhygromyxa salina]
MTTHWLRSLALPSALLGLALTGPGCVGFINGDDTAGDADTTGDAGDGDGDTNTGDGDGGTGTGTGTEMTIYEIQQGGADGSVAAGLQVSVKSVVVVSPVNAEDGLVFVEEQGAGEWSGISLYLWDEVVMSTALQPGDIVDLVGEYTEFFDMSQIVIKNPGDITVVGSVGLDELPGPDVVNAADVARDNPAAESWEGVRVRINDAVIEEANDGFGQYLLAGNALVGNAFVDPLPDVANMGSYAAITGSLHYSFDEFKLQPASADDLDTYMGPPTPMEDTAIYDIRQGMVPQDTLVLVENVVVSSGFTWSDSSEASFFVQEPDGGAFSGIQVHLGDMSGLQIAPGDDVTIVGTYEEFFDMSQLVVPDASGVTVNGSGPGPAPEVIADPATIANGGSMTEDWESVLVQVEDVTVTNENPDAPDEFGEFEITGGLRVDDLFFSFDNWMKPAMGANYTSITGVLVYNFSNYKLEPRDGADLVSN